MTEGYQRHSVQSLESGTVSSTVSEGASTLERARPDGGTDDSQKISSSSFMSVRLGISRRSLHMARFRCQLDRPSKAPSEMYESLFNSLSLAGARKGFC